MRPEQPVASLAKKCREKAIMPHTYQRFSETNVIRAVPHIQLTIFTALGGCVDFTN